MTIILDLKGGAALQAVSEFPQHRRAGINLVSRYLTLRPPCEFDLEFKGSCAVTALTLRLEKMESFLFPL